MYQEYKQSTTYFADWIIKTSNKISSKLKQLPNTLHSLRLRVKEIVEKPLIHQDPDEFSKQLKTALLQGKKAIELRTKVHMIISSNAVSESEASQFTKNNEDHFYCIKVLQDCFIKLKKLLTIIGKEPEKSNLKPSAPSLEGVADIGRGKFDGLEVDFLTEMTEEVLNLDRVPRENLQIADIDKDYGDIRLQLICYLLEITTIDQEVQEVWKKVKNFEISIISATLVTHYALQRLTSIDSTISLIHSSYARADNLFLLIQQTLAPAEFQWWREHPVYQIFSHSVTVLMNYKRDVEKALFPDYSELKESVRDDASTLYMLLVNQFNAFFLRNDKYKNYEEIQIQRKFSSPWMIHLLKYVRDENLILMPVLFQTLIWVRSMQMLEDSTTLFMSKMIYLCRAYRLKRHQNYETYKDKLQVFQEISDFKKIFIIRGYDGWNEPHAAGQGSYPDVYQNPYWAGCFLLDSIFTDQDRCGNLLEGSNFHRTIPFFYKAFREIGLIDENIPILDTFIETFREFIFYNEGKSFPNPKSHTTSEYFNYFYLSKGYLPSELKKLKDKPKTFLPTNWNFMNKYGFLATNLSKFVKDEFIPVEIDKKSISSKEYLQIVLETSIKELPYYSLDLMLYGYLFQQFSRLMKLFIPTPLQGHDEPFRILEKFTLDYLDSTEEQRQSTFFESNRVVVEKLANQLKSFFGKLCLEKKYDENIFIFPAKTSMLQESFMKNFGNVSYHLNYDEENHHNFASICEPFYQKCLSFRSDVAQQTYEKKRELIEEIKEFIRHNVGDVCMLELYAPYQPEAFIVNDTNTPNAKKNKLEGKAIPLKSMKTFLYFFFCDPILNDSDMGEWLWCTYGMRYRITDVDRGNYLLYNAAVRCIEWAYHMIMLATTREMLYRPMNEETGDTFYHLLAKEQQIPRLLEIMMVYHYTSTILNDQGQMYIDCLPETYIGNKLILKNEIKEFHNFLHNGYERMMNLFQRGRDPNFRQQRYQTFDRIADYIEVKESNEKNNKKKRSGPSLKKNVDSKFNSPMLQAKHIQIVRDGFMSFEGGDEMYPQPTSSLLNAAASSSTVSGGGDQKEKEKKSEQELLELVKDSIMKTNRFSIPNAFTNNNTNTDDAKNNNTAGGGEERKKKNKKNNK